MTDVSIHYYNGSSWVDLTGLATAFKIEDHGISQVSSATFNLEGARTDFDTYLSNPYRLIRIRANPGSWQNLFFGYADTPHLKTFAGTITERNKMSIDCLGFPARLAQDYVTFNYYELQSALTPYEGEDSWSFRDMIQDFLDYPDSRDASFDYPTYFEVEAAVDANGIDAAIDAVGNWDNQTLFEAIRLTAEHIGYDGYYYLADETAAPKVRLYPYNKASTTTLEAPFLKEPEWVGGSLADVGNKIFVEGGVDSGVPSDADRWTEYGYTKYTPKIWSATRTGTTPTLTDENNTAFTNEYLRANDKCIKVSTTGSTNPNLHIVLDMTSTGDGVIDASNRVTSLFTNLKAFTSGNQADLFYMNLFLYDDEGNKILYRLGKAINPFGVFSDTIPYSDFTFEQQLSVPLTTEINEKPTGIDFWGYQFHKWYYETGTTFNRDNITTFEIQMSRQEAITDAGKVWGLYIDGFQFVGGKKISQFDPLNPPASDATSISYYGMHPFKHSDAQISSFEHAQTEAARLLANMKDAIGTLKCTKQLPSTQLYPSNVVTVASVDYRIADILYEWNTGHKRVDATYNMVGKLSPLPQIWSKQNELRYLMR